MTQELLSQRVTRCQVNIQAVSEELRRSYLQIGAALDILYAEVEQFQTLAQTHREQEQELRAIAQILSQQGL